MLQEVGRDGTEGWLSSRASTVLSRDGHCVLHCAVSLGCYLQLLLFYLKERHTARRFSTLIEYARLSLSRRLYQLLI